MTTAGKDERNTSAAASLVQDDLTPLMCAVFGGHLTAQCGGQVERQVFRLVIETTCSSGQTCQKPRQKNDTWLQK